MEPLSSLRSGFDFLPLECPGGMRLEVSNGKVVHEADSPANRFFVVESGEVRRYNGSQDSNFHLIDILGRGDWFGGAAIARMPFYDCRAVSVGHSVVWACAAQIIRDYLSRRGDVAIRLIESVIPQLHQSWANAGGMAFDDCRSRLVKTLLRFSDSAAAKKTPEGVVLKITHAQLAQAVGAARETVSICLTELRQKQIVRTGRNQLSFDPERLKEADVP
jgi:CRP-like cAMP-binding protein